MLALVTLGLFSYRRLALDQFPNVEIPVISIVTKYPGASPDTVEREVTKRIEEAVNPIAGVKHVNSSSKENVSIIYVEFTLETKVNDVIQEARAKVNAIRGDLPEGIEDPILQKLDFGAMPVASLAVRSDTMSPVALSTFVDKRIKQRLENIPGVGKVDLVGLSKREVNVVIDRKRMEALGMGINEVISGLQSENVNTPLGALKRGDAEYPLRISGKPKDVAEFPDMVIASRAGRPVRLGEVANVVDGMEEQTSLAQSDREPAIGIDILKQTGANTVEVVDLVKKTVAKLQAELPPGVTIKVVRDGSIFIRDSVEDVKQTMILGGILTVFIVFCFLSSWRSTVITCITLPISVISSFSVMYFLGMTLNIMTLMALSLAIGLLIDDAIVVRENIVRHLERGKDHFQASRDGTNEIGLAVMATSFSVIAVFVPVAYMKGIIGRFFFSFGITVAFAVAVSLLVSFTMDPMLSSRWYDPDIHRKLGTGNFVYRMLDYFNGGFNKLGEFYKKMIGAALSHRLLVVGSALAAFVVGIILFANLPQSFRPDSDQSEFQLTFTTAPYASLKETSNRLNAVLNVLYSFPEVERTFSTIGAGDQGTVRDASVYVRLVDKKKRKRTQFQMEDAVRAKLGTVAGIDMTIKRVGDTDTRKPVMVGIRGPDLDVLKGLAAQLKQGMLTIPDLEDVTASLEHDISEVRMTVDREKALASGLNTAAITRTVSALVGGYAVTTYEDEEGDAVNVRVRLPESERENPNQVGALRLTVPQQNGSVALLPLSAFVSYKQEPTPSEITRQELTRQVSVEASLGGGLALGTAMNEVKKKVADLKLPPGYNVYYLGEAEQMAESFGYIYESLALAIIFVYLILAAQFESFIDPFAIMFSLPLSIVGMAGMLFLTHDTLSIMSQIGLIMLMGLVTKNAILLIDFTKQIRALEPACCPSEGKEVREEIRRVRKKALIMAGAIRLRPIMMTTLAMIFGMLPLAFALGPGAEMRAPMARAVVGGLITSTLLTLIVVPVVYTILDDLVILYRTWRPKRRPEDFSAPGEGEAADVHGRRP